MLQRTALIVAVALCNFFHSQSAQASDCPEFTFLKVGPFGANTNPVSVATADFNKDSRPDLVVANQQSGDVSVLLGNGDGSFQTASNYPSGLYPQAVAVGDFNHDSKMDFVVANAYVAGTVSVFLGNGDGTFPPAVTYDTGPGPLAMAVGDLNGDGHLDLAVADDDGISVLLGKVDGTFHGATNYAAGDFAVALGRFDAGNTLDLVVANNSGASVLWATGRHFPGTCELPAEWGHFVAVADFNDDDKDDLAVANFLTLARSQC
jgi:hypothetical protein